MIRCWLLATAALVLRTVSAATAQSGLDPTETSTRDDVRALHGPPEAGAFDVGRT